MIIKPMLAEDWVAEETKFPIRCQPKIDGVRGLNQGYGLVGRSLKKHRNPHATARFSGDIYAGIDGELWVGPSDRALNLCRTTSSHLSRGYGTPDVSWTAFDYVTADSINEPYSVRYEMLAEQVARIGDEKLLLIPCTLVKSMEELLTAETQLLGLGYEGVCLRRPTAKHKQGRSTVSSNDLLRIKRFSEAEALVLRIIEGNINNNEAEINELGRTERSSHQENMEPSGMVGALRVRFSDGTEGKVSAGSMDLATRRLYFLHPELIVGKMIKFKSFLHGKKDKPRFPTFVCIRDESDIS